MKYFGLFFIKKYGEGFISTKPKTMTWNSFCCDIFRSEIVHDLDASLVLSSEKGKPELVNFFFLRGAASYGGLDWDFGLYQSARMGNKDLLIFYIERGAGNFRWCLKEASTGGHRHIIDFLIDDKNVNNWDDGLKGAAEGGHEDLIDFFIEKGANDWDGGMNKAAKGGHRKLVDRFISLGAEDYICGMEGAIDGKQGDLFTFFKKKLRI